MRSPIIAVRWSWIEKSALTPRCVASCYCDARGEPFPFVGVVVIVARVILTPSAVLRLGNCEKIARDVKFQFRAGGQEATKFTRDRWPFEKCSFPACVLRHQRPHPAKCNATCKMETRTCGEWVINGPVDLSRCFFGVLYVLLLRRFAKWQECRWHWWTTRRN